MRAPLQRIVDELLATNSELITLDQIGDALGDSFVTTEEIDAIVETLESAGRRVGIEDEGRGIERLRSVLDAARDLRLSLGRSPTAQEISEKTGLTDFAVRHALALAKIMQK